MEYFFEKKRAQAWSLDIIIASVIFILGIIILYVYAVNYPSHSRDKLDELFYEGNLASELILGEEDFGIVSNGKVNQTKLNDFSGMNYQYKREQLGVRNDFYFTFEGLEVNGNPKDYVGKMNSSDTEHVIQVTRITVYKNDLTKFHLYVWA